MKTHALSLGAAAVVGFVAAAVCFTAWTPRPAGAQFKGLPQPQTLPLPGGTSVLGATAAVTPNPQPLAIQALDGEHFVVVSREPRLVTQIGREGTAQNMLVTVVTHYTVRADRLVPIERVQAPTGYRAVTTEEN